MTIPQLMLELGVDQENNDQIEALRRASNKRAVCFDRICERHSLTRKGLALMEGETIADWIGEAGFPKPDAVSAKMYAGEYAASEER